MLSQKYTTKNLVASSLITGANLFLFLFFSLVTLLAGRHQTSWNVACSLCLGSGALYFLLKVITLSLANTRAYRVLDTITSCFHYLFLMCLLYPLAFGITFDPRGWIAFGLITAWGFLMLIYTAIFYLRYWRWTYAVSLVTWIVCLILIFTFIPVDLGLITAFILGCLAYYYDKTDPKFLVISCLAETLMLCLFTFGLLF